MIRNPLKKGRKIVFESEKGAVGI